MMLTVRSFARVGIALLVLGAQCVAASAGQPKLDADTCRQLHTEQETFIKSGILGDLQHGADWGKANLSPDRLREVEHYILLDEQIKFACREATMTPELERASEIAKRIEANPNLDPFAPLPDPAAQPKQGKANDEAGSTDDDTAPAKPVKKKSSAKRKAKAQTAGTAGNDAYSPAKAAETKSQQAKPEDADSQPKPRKIPLTTEPIP